MKKVKVTKSLVSKFDIANFLKRKRLEMGIRLDDLSAGICSTSYLSRIENNQVQVDDTYYKLLFEKLHVDYDSMNKERTHNVYNELLIMYIGNQRMELETFVKHAIESNHYIDLELQLILLFSNIIRGNYEEARLLLIKFENLADSFANTELLFYMFCGALYSYKTNQNRKAYSQILVLTSIKYEDHFFECCVYDLAIDIMMAVGQDSLTCKYFAYFEKYASQAIFVKKRNVHYLQLLTIDADLDYHESLEKYTYAMKYFDINDLELTEPYYYYLGIIHYRNGQYETVINELINHCLSARILILLLSSSMHLNNENIQKQVFVLLSNYGFSKYEMLYHDFAMFLKMLKDNESGYRLFNYLKDLLLNSKYFYDDLINGEAIQYYIALGFECSKYKECARFLKNYLKMTKDEYLKN